MKAVTSAVKMRTRTKVLLMTPESVTSMGAAALKKPVGKRFEPGVVFKKQIKISKKSTQDQD